VKRWKFIALVAGVAARPLLAGAQQRAKLPNPGDLPIEQPTRLQFVVNLKTAQQAAEMGWVAGRSAYSITALSRASTAGGMRDPARLDAFLATGSPHRQEHAVSRIIIADLSTKPLTKAAYS
jgi:hypothetical protein